LGILLGKIDYIFIIMMVYLNQNAIPQIFQFSVDVGNIAILA